MNKLKLKEALYKHRAWMEDSGKGEKADLRGANLRGASLRYVNLRYADLRGANLRESDLRGADLHGADLHGADLHGANLHGANLRETDLSDARGFLLLPAQDPRGYSCPHAVLHDNWMIRAGCRFFTIEQAKEHWGENYPHDREIGDMYLHAIEWLEAKIKRMDLSTTKGVGE